VGPEHRGRVPGVLGAGPLKTITQPYRVALTGGIASGKTTVANLFAAKGIPLIDTDVIAREVVEPGQPALAAVVDAFGPTVLDAQGRLDRRRLRDIIFGDASARRRLESILHPAIRLEMDRQSQAATSLAPYQILVIPLLTEGGRRDHVDRVLVVDAPESLQIGRLMARDSVSRDQAEASLRAQAPRDARLAIADDVVLNTGRVEDLDVQVTALHRKYLALAAEKAGPG
jgi:dephospho-CoA kinase